MLNFYVINVRGDFRGKHTIIPKIQPILILLQFRMNVKGDTIKITYFCKNFYIYSDENKYKL